MRPRWPGPGSWTTQHSGCQVHESWGVEDLVGSRLPGPLHGVSWICKPWSLRIQWNPGLMVWILGPTCNSGCWAQLAWPRSVVCLRAGHHVHEPQVQDFGGAQVTWPKLLGLPVWWVPGLSVAPKLGGPVGWACELWGQGLQSGPGCLSQVSGPACTRGPGPMSPGGRCTVCPKSPGLDPWTRL